MTGPGRRHLIGALVGIVLVGVTAVVPIVVSGGYCARTVPLQVTSSTEKVTLITEFARQYNDSHRAVGGVCGEVQVRGISSGAMKNAIAAGTERTDVWLPTSSMWLRLLEHDKRGGLFVRDPAPRSVVTSTLVIAMPQDTANALRDRGTPLRRWADVLSLGQQGWAAYGKPEWGDFVLGRDNAETSTSGLSATVATYVAAKGGDITQASLDDPQVVGFVHGIESSVARYGIEAVAFMEEIYAAEQAAGTAPHRPYIDALVVQEQMVYMYNRGAPGGDPKSFDRGARPTEPLQVVYPEDGTLQLDHPFVVMSSAAADQRAVAEDFRTFLADGPRQQRFADFGFRLPGDATHPTEQIVQTLGEPSTQNLHLVPIPDGNLLAQMLSRWDTVRRKARVLLVL
ncbi:MAG: substrate-binding domain-containing protein, partial [Pseudonocardia sp.]